MKKEAFPAVAVLKIWLEKQTRKSFDSAVDNLDGHFYALNIFILLLKYVSVIRLIDPVWEISPGRIRKRKEKNVCFLE